jgi:hypothetical protein
MDAIVAGKEQRQRSFHWVFDLVAKSAQTGIRMDSIEQPHRLGNSLGKAAQDLRYGLRTLGRAPGFAVISILVMALGIGATTSLFTIVRSVLLKALPFESPDKLVMVYEHFRKNDTP